MIESSTGMRRRRTITTSGESIRLGAIDRAMPPAGRCPADLPRGEAGCVIRELTSTAFLAPSTLPPTTRRVCASRCRGRAVPARSASETTGGRDVSHATRRFVPGQRSPSSPSPPEAPPQARPAVRSAACGGRWDDVPCPEAAATGEAPASECGTSADVPVVSSRRVRPRCPSPARRRLASGTPHALSTRSSARRRRGRSGRSGLVRNGPRGGLTHEAAPSRGQPPARPPRRRVVAGGSGYRHRSTHSHHRHVGPVRCGRPARVRTPRECRRALCSCRSRPGPPHGRATGASRR